MSLGEIYSIWPESAVAPRGCDILIRRWRRWLDTEQRRFLEGISDREPSWLKIAKGMCAGRSENTWWAR